MLVPERLRKYTARWSRGGGGKYQQTDSDGSDGDGLPFQRPSDIAACHFARDLEIYSKVEYNEKRLFRLMAQRTMNVTCVARLFRLMALRTKYISL